MNELELLAVKCATQYFEHYLLGTHRAIETDHKARANTECGKCVGYHMTLKYVSGSQMGITDYLGRDPKAEASPPQMRVS